MLVVKVHVLYLILNLSPQTDLGPVTFDYHTDTKWTIEKAFSITISFAEFNVSTLYIIADRVFFLQILRSVAYSFAVLCCLNVNFVTYFGAVGLL